MSSADKQGETRVHDGDTTAMRVCPAAGLLHRLLITLSKREKFWSEAQMKLENNVSTRRRRQVDI